MSSQEKTDIEPKRLLIIGNGFDLHCGLHSSFREFISAQYGEHTKSDPMILISQENEKIKEMMSTRTSINAIKDLSHWIPIVAHENLWVAWLTFLRCCQETTKNWADVESQMTTLLTNHTVEKVLKQNEDVFEHDLKSESDSVFFF
ncbi:AbiH family protein [Lacticaseibacillus paracasei]|nr:AbiH family protein [Lacticaseibacillus paracasei]